MRRGSSLVNLRGTLLLRGRILVSPGQPAGRKLSRFIGTGANLLTRRRRTLLTFFFTLVIGAVVTVFVARIESSRHQAAFDRTLAEFSGAVTEQITRDITFLRATRAWVETAFQSGHTQKFSTLTRTDFASYVEKLGLKPPDGGLQGLGFVPIIDADNVAEIDARLRRDYGDQRSIWPKSSAPLRTAIMLLEPANPRNQAAIGYDMYSEPVRRRAMDAALSSDLPSASAPVVLVQELDADRQAGLLIFLSVTSQRQSGSQPDAFVYTPIRAGDLFDSVSAGYLKRLNIRVTDIGAPELPLYTSPGFSAGSVYRSGGIMIDVADRKWRIDAQEPGDADLFATRPFTLLTAAMMFLLALFAALAAQAAGSAMTRARELNRLQQTALREKDLHLREMSHRLKNSLTRVAAMARQAARGAESKEDFVRSMNLRLQAMAGAQDMLTRSENGRADLRSLIEAELAQIASHEGHASEAERHIEGPAVLLDARETQALGLTLHELATNTLKYGAGSIPGGRLTIHWQVTREGSTRRLQLIWEEEGLPVQPAATAGATGLSPQKKGFGSQLIEACIRIELGGIIRRSFQPGQMRVDISIPLNNCGG